MSEYFKIAPFAGLSMQNVSDSVRPPGSMRGGSNVMVKDGEWWVRPGEVSQYGSSLASALFHWVVDIGDTDIARNVLLISEWMVLFSTYAGTSWTPAVVEVGTAAMTMTNGSQTAVLTAGTAPVADQMLCVDAPPHPANKIYRCLAYAAPNCTLDRPFVGTTGGGKSVHLYNPFFAGASPFPNPPADLRTTYCVFEQLVAHTANDMWAGSPALRANTKYLIVASEKYGLKILSLDAFEDQFSDFFRNTAVATPTAPTGGFFVTRYGDILVIGAASDPNGFAQERTIWFSRPGDLVTWHTGQQGAGGMPNHLTMDGYEAGFDNPITGVEPVGNTLCIFRALDTNVCRPSGATGVPLTTQRVASIGLTRPNLLANMGEQIAFVARDGLYMIGADGNVQPMSTKFETLFETLGLRQHYPYIRRVFHWKKFNRLMLVFDKNTNTHAYAGPMGGSDDTTVVSVPLVGSTAFYSSRQGVLVHDLISSEWWLEDHPAIAGFGQLLRPPTASSNAYSDDYVTIRFNGAINAISTGMDGDLLTGTSVGGKDAAEVASSANATLAAPAVVKAWAETGWFDLGSGMWKQLQRMIILARSLSNLTDLDAGVWHLATVDLYSDWNHDTVRETFDLTVSSTGLSSAREGQALPPSNVFVISPSIGGHVFKLRITNALSAAGIAAGRKQAHFRLSEIGVFYQPMESVRPLTAITGT